MITGHFVDAYLPVLDGVVRTVQAYQAYMQQSLGPSYVVAPKQPGYVDTHAHVLRYLSVPFRPPYRVGLAPLDLLLERRLRKIAFDVIHSHSPFGGGQLALRWARRLGVPLVFTLHSRYPEWTAKQYVRKPSWATLFLTDAVTRRGHAQKLAIRDLMQATSEGLAFSIQAIQRLVWNYARQASCVIVPGHAIRQEFLSYANAFGAAERKPAPRVEVIAHGIDFPITHDHFNVREHHQVASDVPLFLFVGQIGFEKEIPFLLQALCTLKERGQDFRMLFVGEGPASVELEALATDLGLAGRCVFVGAIQNKQRLAAYYAQSDLFLFPSLYETQGLVVMEAASFGLPTVGQQDAPGLSEYLVHDHTGFFSQRETQAYAALVHALCGNLQRAREVGQRASKQCVIRAEKSIQDVNALYKDLLGKRVVVQPTALGVS